MGGSERRADDAVEEGLALFQQGRLDQAVVLWKEAQSLAPDHTRAQEYLDYVTANREALEQRFRLAETQLFGGSAEEAAAPLDDVPSKMKLPEINGDEEEDEEDEPTVSMPAKVLADGLAQSRDSSQGSPDDYLEVMEGGGEEAVDDFEPMEKTPVGIHIPDPVRLVATDREEDEGEDGVYEWDEDTPSVREVGQAPLSEEDELVGLTTGAELNLEEEGEGIEELDDADIVEEIKAEPDLDGVEVKFRSLAEFDAAYEEEYVGDEDLDEVDEAVEPRGEVQLELEEEPEPDDVHVRETMKVPIEPDRGPALELEPEPDTLYNLVGGSDANNACVIVVFCLMIAISSWLPVGQLP